MDFEEIKEAIESADSYSDIYDILDSNDLDADYMLEDYANDSEVVDTLLELVQSNGLEALRDFQDLDPYGQIFRKDVGYGYYEDSSLDEMKDDVID